MIAVPFGTIGIAWSTVVFGAMAFVINAYYSRKFLGYGAWHQARDTLPIVLISIAMCLATSWVGSQWEAGPVSKLIGLSAFGVMLFVALAGLFRLQAMGELADMLRQRGVRA